MSIRLLNSRSTARYPLSIISRSMSSTIPKKSAGSNQDSSVGPMCKLVFFLSFLSFLQLNWKWNTDIFWL